MRRLLAAFLSLVCALAPLTSYAAGQIAVPQRGPGHQLATIPGVENMPVGGLQHLIACMRAMHAGTADCVIELEGDSVTEDANDAGFSASIGDTFTNIRSNGGVAQLKARLVAAGIPASIDGWLGDGFNQAFTPPNAVGSGNDALVNQGTGVVVGGGGFVFTSGTGWVSQATSATHKSVGGQPIENTTDTTSTVTYTMFDSATDCAIRYQQNTSTFGTLNWSIDGNSDVTAGQNVTENGATQTILSKTIHLGTTGIHTLAFRASALGSGNFVNLLGLHCWDTTKRRVIFITAGAQSWSSAIWLAGTTGFNQGLGLDRVSAPDSPTSVVFEMNAINDYDVTLTKFYDDLYLQLGMRQRHLTVQNADFVKVWPHPAFTSGGQPSAGNASAWGLLNSLRAASRHFNFSLINLSTDYTTPAAWAAAGYQATNYHPDHAGYGYRASKLAPFFQAAWNYAGGGVALDQANCLIVGAGGAGGSSNTAGAAAGGGGAGGVLSTPCNFAAGTYTVSVGAGGAAAANAQGLIGGQSSVGGIVAPGGGGGGNSVTATKPGITGGSGGGAGSDGSSSGAAGVGTTGEGSSGGTAGAAITTDAGGGGGASAVGSNGATTAGGAGGAGVSNSISGGAITYGGGGGGSGSVSGGAGGAGGGGAGAATSGAGTAGTANRGGGGGGGIGVAQAGGAGGSGEVVFSYVAAAFTATCSGCTTTTSGSNTIMTFNASGTITFP